MQLKDTHQKAAKSKVLFNHKTFQLEDIYLPSCIWSISTSRFNFSASRKLTFISPRPFFQSKSLIYCDHCKRKTFLLDAPHSNHSGFAWENQRNKGVSKSRWPWKRELTLNNGEMCGSSKHESWTKMVMSSICKAVILSFEYLTGLCVKVLTDQNKAPLNEQFLKYWWSLGKLLTFKATTVRTYKRVQFVSQKIWTVR